MYLWVGAINRQQVNDETLKYAKAYMHSIVLLYVEGRRVEASM